MFDSHIASLLDVAVDLVNALTDGHAHGRTFVAPRETEARVVAVRQVLPRPAEVAADDAETFAGIARSLRIAFDATDAGDIARAARALNDLLRSTGARPQLDQVDDEPWQVHFHGSDDSLAIGWGAGCATALAFAVGSPLAGRLGVCAAHACDRVYVDTSRNATRRFCSTGCQNRAKAAAFRARRTAER